MTTDAAELVRLAAELSQALFEEAHEVFARDGQRPELVLLAAHGLYGQLVNLSRREWLAGWRFNPLEGTVSVSLPGVDALLIGSSTMTPGSWMVLRRTGR